MCPVRVYRLDSRRHDNPDNAWTVKLIDLIKLNYQTFSGLSRRIDCFTAMKRDEASRVYRVSSTAGLAGRRCKGAGTR